MSEMTRRKFITAVGVLSGAAAVAPLVARAEGGVTPEPAQPVYWAQVGEAKDFPVGATTKAVYPSQFGGGFGYIRRDSDKQLTGLSSKCVHRHCPVNYDAANKVFNCPCHHAQYSATGEHLSGPGHGNLAELRAKIDDKGVVWLQSLTPPLAG